MKPANPLPSPRDGICAETRVRERRVFIFLTVVMAPILAVALVGTYGLLIWLYQMFQGPPTG